MKNLNNSMRVYHRYLGFFLAGGTEPTPMLDTN